MPPSSCDFTEKNPTDLTVSRTGLCEVRDLPTVAIKPAMKQRWWCKSQLVRGSWLLASLGENICPSSVEKVAKERVPLC